MILLDALASAILGEVIHEAVLKIRQLGKDPYLDTLEIFLGDLESNGCQMEIRECIRSTLLREDLVSCDSHDYTNFYEMCLASYTRDVGEPEKSERDALEEACTYFYSQFRRAFDFMIKEHPMYELNRLLTAITIPSIASESYLDKDCTGEDEADLFRPEPKWIDFEKGYFIERDEKEEVFSKLQRKNIHVIYGSPSSGKSHFVRYLAYLFLKKAYEVYILELKREEIGEQYKKDVTLLAERKRCVLVIDDAHLDVNGVDYVIDRVNGKHLILILSARPLNSKSDPYPKSTLERIMKDKRVSTELASINIAPRIVSLYSTLIAGEKEIKVPSSMMKEIISRYGKDLWLLKWALEAYEGGDTIPEETIHRKIAQERFYRYEYERGKYLHNVGEMFYYVSLFSMYEFPVERGFVLQKIGSREADFEKMLNSKEFIMTEDNRIMLHHSSIANIYLSTLLSGTYRVSEYKPEKPEEIFSEYFEMYPWNAIRFMGVLGSWQYSRWNTIRDLVSKVGVPKIKQAMDQKDDLGAIRNCISSITEADPDAGRRLVSVLDLPILINKINRTDGLKSVGYCVSSIIEADADVGKRLLTTLAKKIDQSDNLRAIRYCISSITRADPDAGRRLVSVLDLPILAKKIDQAINLRAIIYCLSSIEKANLDVLVKLISLLDHECLQQKLSET